MTQSSMLHVRVDENLKAEATAKLAEVGLTLSDAVRILLTRITKEGGLPAALTSDPDSYNEWFRAKVFEALADSGPHISNEAVMDNAQAIIDRKSNAYSRMDSGGSK